MKWETEIIIFVMCLNLSTGLIVELGAPGTDYVSPVSSENASDYEGHYNITEIAKGWETSRINQYGLLGDVVYAFNTFFRLVSYVFVGFPVFLYSLGDNFLTDEAGIIAYHSICVAIGALFFVVMAFYIVWFISGREL